MPRLNVVDPASATGPAKEAFDGPLKGKHLNIFKAMANSPAGLHFYLGTAQALGKAQLNDKEREVVQLAIANANNCEYCAAAHTAIGKGAGLSEDQTVAARRGKLDDPKLNALAKFALALHEKRGFVSDADLKTFRDAGFNDGHVIEVIATYTQATFTNFVNHVNQTTVDFPKPPAI